MIIEPLANKNRRWRRQEISDSFFENCKVDQTRAPAYDKISVPSGLEHQNGIQSRSSEQDMRSRVPLCP